MDYDVQRCTRQCAKTERALEPGETFYSVLSAAGASLVRYDYSVEAWSGPPDGSLGWWKSQMPLRDGRKVQWAPNDVMLHLLEELEAEPDRGDMRYVLALLLVRRRVLRLEEYEQDAQGREILVGYSGKSDMTYHVPVVVPSESRTAEIQEELSRLLVSSAG